MYQLKTQVKGMGTVEINQTYGELMMLALLSNSPHEAETEKYRCYSLAQRTEDKETADFDKEEVEFITRKAQRILPPLHFGRLKDFLDAGLKKDA
jgi:hypothetical protein